MADGLNFNDANLSDLIGAYSDGAGTLTLRFNTGNGVTIQGNDTLSAAIVFADSSWRFNNTTQTWQSA